MLNATILSGVTDRVAAIVQTLQSATETAAVASAPGDLFRRISISNDYSIEKDFITPAHNFEGQLTAIDLLSSNSAFASVINSFDTHVSSNLPGTSFDAFLSSIGFKVSEYFARAYAGVKGTGLSGKNVFAESEVALATFERVGALNWTFDQVQDLGTGDGTYTQTPLNTGDQLLMAALPSGVSTSSGTFQASGLNDAGAIVQSEFTFPSGVANAHVLVSPTLKFRTVTNMTAVADTGISNGSVIILTNKKERIIAL
jgi:hypothetical protein